MARFIFKELDKIKKKILSLGALVEERVRMTSTAVENRDAVLAEKIIKCLKILALHQPVAIDLRFIVAVIKINNDLERIGDQAVNIAERVVIMSKRPEMGFVFDYIPMSEKAQSMLKMSLDALVNLDVDLAFKVITLDDEVDATKKDAYDKIKEAIRRNPDRVGYLINLLLISRHLERLADHCTNIAEEVIYLIEGEIIRHGKYE
jgi:phosphate transport system protein